MNTVAWLIALVPVAIVLAIGFHTRKYIRGVADFLMAGRLCGRYVITVGDVANALSILGLVAYVEVHYKTGFAVAFWNAMTGPLGLLLALTGYCVYRFRETKALSLGQFLEMRYSRSLRIFAAALRSLSEILANMIMPSIAARFFIYFFGLPQTFTVFGWTFSTFVALMVLCLTAAISLIYMGGTLALVITDAFQGMICYPIMGLFAIFLLTRFSWNGEIVPTMLDRAQGQSFLNPYDVDQLRDFNLFMVLLGIFTTVWHRASWLGAGTSGAARSPHEQKMAGVLGAFRGHIMSVLYVLIAAGIITLLNHRSYVPQARKIRLEISRGVSAEVVKDAALRERLMHRLEALEVSPETYKHQLSDKENNETPWMNTAHETFKDAASGLSSGDANSLFQRFRAMFHQQMMAVTMRNLLPPVMMGFFCLLMILAMISTDDTRIFSSALTITQDVVLPLRGRPFTPRQHIWALRIVSIGVGIFFLCGSTFMAQIDYINMFTTLMTQMWMSGCGPVMIFGLYSRFGTTKGAYASLCTGMGLAFANIFLQRNWAKVVYPWLERIGGVEPVGRFLETVSRPFHPIVVWKMDAVRFPINSYESYFVNMIITLIVYCGVSWLTMKEPFNLDRMLHRGIYNTDGDIKIKTRWTWRNALAKIVGITPAHTRGDRAIAWGIFGYSFVYHFLIMFIGVVIWNAVSPWPVKWWGTYFLVSSLIVSGGMAFLVGVWFMLGGIRDMRRLFRDLRARDADPLDNGTVDGHVSLADKAKFERIEKESEKQS